MDSRCSLPSNALVGGGNDNFGTFLPVAMHHACVTGNHRAGSSSAEVCHDAVMLGFVPQPNLHFVCRCWKPLPACFVAMHVSTAA